MVLDTLANARLYHALGARLCIALEFLADPQTAAFEPAGVGLEHTLRVPIQGDEVFALVQRYRTKRPSDAFWEAHRRYIDVQCVIEGVELMGHADLRSMRVERDYDAERDFTKLEPSRGDQPCNFIRVRAGSFAIFFPSDAHMPGISVDDASAEVKKIVMKVGA